MEAKKYCPLHEGRDHYVSHGPPSSLRRSKFPRSFSPRHASRGRPDKHPRPLVWRGSAYDVMRVSGRRIRRGRRGEERTVPGPLRSSLTPPPPLTLFFIDQCQCHSSRGRPRTLPSCSCSWNPASSPAVVSDFVSCFAAVYCCDPASPSLHLHPNPVLLPLSASSSPLAWGCTLRGPAGTVCICVTRRLCLVTCALTTRAMLMTLNNLRILLRPQ